MRRVLALVAILIIAVSIAVMGETIPTLRFSLPPVLEALPIAFADAWGLFDKHGVSVELVGLTDNQDRSVAFSANQIDGMFADITRSIYDATTGSDVLITSAAQLRPQTDSLSLALLSPDTHFGYATLDDLIDAGEAISTIYRSDYEYVLDQYLEETFGRDARSIRTTYWNDTLMMAVWFGAQSIPSAMLPEPYVSYISTYHPPNGEPLALNVLADLSHLGPLPTILLFRASYFRDYPEAVEAFYAGYVEAIERINTTPREDLVDEGIDIAVGLFFEGADRTTINQEVLDALSIPYFELPSALEPELYESVAEWILEKGYVYSQLPSFDELTDFQFVP